MNNLSKLRDFKSALNSLFYERENVIEGLLISLLARQHLLLIGPVGTAKSAIVVELLKNIKDAKYFQWQLTKFSSPEELFGPLSLKDLEHGLYKRNTSRKMPEAHVAFLDELFKSNSAILNSLLTLINERLFYNGGEPTKVPLLSVIGASNEIPEEGEGLEALFDRFLLRFEVNYIKEETNFLSMLKRDDQLKVGSSITIDELYFYQELTDKVVIHDKIYEALAKIRQELSDEGIRPSDRRFKHCLGILRAKALLQQRQVVHEEDLIILENVLWETLDEREMTSIIIRRHAEDVVIRKLDTIQAEAIELFNIVLQQHCADAGLEVSQKLKALMADLTNLKRTQQHRAKEIEVLLSKVKAMHEEILTFLLEPLYFDASSKVREFKQEMSSLYYKS